MQQLTGLDAAFLAMETAAVFGHVGSISDPAADGAAHARLGDQTGGGAAASAPPVPTATGVGAARARPALLDRGPGLRHRIPRARDRAARARGRRAARRAGRPPARPAARPQPPAVGDLPDHRAVRRAVRALHQGPPRGDRRRLGQRPDVRAARPDAEGRTPGEVPESTFMPETAAGHGYLLARSARLAHRPPGAGGAARRAVGRAGARFAPSLTGAIPLRRSSTCCCAGRTTSRCSQPGAARPKTPFNTPITPHRRWAFCDVPLAEVKAVKNAAGATVNDVVMALCAGALRRWLIDHDALPEGPLLAAVPVSIRTEAEKGASGNRISTMIAALPTQLADPKMRLEAAHEAMTVAKEHPRRAAGGPALRRHAVRDAGARRAGRPARRAAADGRAAVAVQPVHLQRAGTQHPAVFRRRQAARATTRCRRSPTGRGSTSR